MYELLGLYVTLIGGFFGIFVLLLQMKDEISEIKIDFAKCPWHGKKNNSVSTKGAV